jgi:hypothetical protein
MMFSACDKFNKKIRDFDWPYRSSCWQLHLHEIYMTHAVINCLSLYREVHFEHQKNLSDCDLLRTLSRELYERAKKNEFSWV